MFGGGLNQSWPFAALASEGLSRFSEEFAEAVRISEILIESLSRMKNFVVSRIPNGSNIFCLELAEGTAAATKFAAAVRKRAILLPEASAGRFHLKVNTSLLGWEAAHIAAEFQAAAAEAASGA
jgi:hypothetical protein